MSELLDQLSQGTQPSTSSIRCQTSKRSSLDAPDQPDCQLSAPECPLSCHEEQKNHLAEARLNSQPVKQNKIVFFSR